MVKLLVLFFCFPCGFYIKKAYDLHKHLDELIRQVTISCQERGLLLLRIRDEIRMSIAAYQTLYESSVAFGMRKALQAEQGKSDMEARVMMHFKLFF